MSNLSTATEVDAGVWRAIAGASVQIPSTHSYVYYFPEGHIEHSPSPAIVNSNTPLKRPLILCQVLSVRLLSSNISDQVFAKILLQPLHPHVQREENRDGNGDDLQNVVVPFAKILTPSDANNGGGFSVPRYCAESIFPPLDFEADPPVQNLTMRDTNNNAWEFRHIYRGTPRRHLLTTGWSKFVNAKRLVAGDSAVFMRKESTDELFIGVRRAVRLGTKNAWTTAETAANGSKDEVMEAMENAVKGIAFEVVYYPRAGLPDFVVSAERVEDALRICWTPGMQVKMAVESEDSSRISWYQGAITAAASLDAGPWSRSPWRMLQVTWDEAQPLQNMNRLNPWQIEYVLPLPQFHSPFPHHKKLKVLQHHGKLPDEEENCYVPMNDITNATAENLNLSMFNNSSFPGSMQGARRDRCSISSLSNSESDNSLQTFTNLLTNGAGSKSKHVSAALKTKNSPLDNLSSSSQNSDQFCGIGSSGQQGHPPSSPIGGHSFQLFGKLIQIPKPVECGLINEDCCTDGGYQENSIISNQPNSSPNQNSNGLLVRL
ncbi:auxin response factor 17 [Dorcoceras hygrometricum]|uniref:Auxin response factor n=1 Tax=Dorcoceras hygrometricum TaxID=472368 RepID=A0A2Z7C258_9LAMI|nr:auxin response factor 17 [Dorcoceras hygrometricum]